MNIKEIDFSKGRELGATHYVEECETYKFHWVKYSGERALTNLGSDGAEWVSGASDPALAKPIPRMRTEYVRVEDSIFDLRDDFESGKIYFLHSSGYEKVVEINMLLVRWEEKRLYRKVQTPIDEVEEAAEWLWNNNPMTEHSWEMLSEKYKIEYRFIAEKTGFRKPE